MTVTIGWWGLPTLISLTAWAWAILMPLPTSSGHYDFGGALTGAFRGVVATFVTLLAWLAYFICKSL
jgi:hypothetical protein